MTKYILITLIFSALAFSTKAQEKNNPLDTIPVTKPMKMPADTVVNPTDTIPPVKKPKIIPKETEETVKSSSQDDQSREEPKIIYYQSVEKNDKWSSVKVKNRKRNRKSDIHTLTGGNSHGGGFGALSFKSTELMDETIVMAGVRAGWIVNRTLGIGFEGFGIIPTATLKDVSTKDITPLGGYGGMFLELIFFSNQVVHVTFPVSAGAGWLGYFEDDANTFGNLDGDQIADDVFWYVEPGIDIEVNIARNFRLAGGVSRRFTQDLVLPNTKGSDFNTLSYFLTLKVGSF